MNNKENNKVPFYANLKKQNTIILAIVIAIGIILFIIWSVK